MKTKSKTLILILAGSIFLTVLLWGLIGKARNNQATDQVVDTDNLSGPCGIRGCEEVPPKPKGIDLDVTYISRTPMYNRYQVEYNEAGEPYLAEGTQNDQRWPKQGELVTFTAYIMNKGTAESGAFAYQWLLDDQVMQSGVHPTLAAGAETTVSFDWEWSHPSDGERLLGSHTIGFWVDPNNAIIETFEKNNSVEDHTDASSLAILLTPEVYEALERPINKDQSYSAEDWLQRQISAMNDALGSSVFVSAPHGSLERVRLDKIIITEANQLVDYQQDGQFFITEDVRFKQAYYDPYADVSGWLIHELSHLLGVVDIYKLDVPLETLRVLDCNDQPVQIEHKASVLYGGILSDPGVTPKRFDEHTVLALNLNKGYRRGYYGEYLYDVPKQTSLLVLDSEGKPATDVRVRLYQRVFTPKINGSTAGTIDNQFEFEGMTGSNGTLVLANRQVPDSGFTATGHRLVDNPFSLINVTGSNGMFLVELQKGTHQEFNWLDITDLNQAAWNGNSAIEMPSHIPVENAPIVPITLTGIQQGGDVQLQWTVEGEFERIRFNLYRASGPGYKFEPILTKVRKTAYTGKLDNQSRSVIYAVTAVNSEDIESGFSNFFYALPLAGPTAVVINADNNRIILDPKNGYSLLSQSAEGKYQQVLGSYQNHLDRSKYMTLGSDGLLYVTHPGDAYSDRQSIQVFNQTLTLQREFGLAGSDSVQLDDPAGIAIWGEPCVDNSCRILVSDSGNNRILVFDMKGVLMSSFGRKGWWQGQFHSPQGIAVDSQGRVAVVDSGNNRLQVFNFDGNEFKHLKTIRRGFKAPSGIAIYGSDYFVVADTGHNKIKVLSSTGQLIKEYSGGRQEYFGNFSRPIGVAVDLDGNILVADTGNRRIVQLSGVFPIP